MLTNIRACLKDIPDNVIFHLKRFDFNLRTLQRSKINDYFSFPARVNLRPYTVEHLTQSGDEEEEDIFELVGILVHAGTAESGHYYSYIRERPTSHSTFNWVEFNDDMVSPWDPATMENSTFGGPDPRPVYETNGIMYDKSYSAYMLFYQRASSLKVEQEDLVRTQSSSSFSADMPINLKEHILDENTVLLRRHCLFGPTHIGLVKNLFQQARTLAATESEVSGNSSAFPESSPRKREEDDFQEEAMQLALSHLDQIISRAKDVPDFPALANMLRDAIGIPSWAFEFYNYFNKRHAAFRALLQRNPDPGIRSFISNSFASSLEVVSKNLTPLYGPSDSLYSTPETDDEDDGFSQESVIAGQLVLEGSMDLFNHLWRYFHIHIKAWDEYFGLILKFAKLGRREVACLLREDFLSRVLLIISADTSMELPPNYQRMLHNIYRRNNTRPPSYVAIVELAGYLMRNLASELSADTIVDDPKARTEENVDELNWTSNEVHLVHDPLDRQVGSAFVEKLLLLDQAHAATDSILEFLVHLSSPMDTKILRTLRLCIQGETSAQPMDPFLRGAGVYLENTAKGEHATKIVDHIHNQVGSLQGSEASFFLDFMAKALHLDRSDIRVQIQLHTLELVPKWAPYLLVASERPIRARTEDFLSKEIYNLAASGSVEQEAGEEEPQPQPASVARDMLRQLGLQILMHLQENYVGKRMQLGEDASATVLRVLERCSSEYEMDPANRSDFDAEIFAMREGKLIANDSG